MKKSELRKLIKEELLNQFKNEVILTEGKGKIEADKIIER
jgi:hypothetical protein